MDFLSFNDIIRRYILEKVNLDNKYSNESIKEFYNEIILNNDNDKNKILSIMHLTSYIVNYFTYKKFPLDEELIMKNEYYSNLTKLNSKIDLDSFKELCDDLVFFCSLDEYYKKEYVLKSKDNINHILKLFPCYINDLMKYSFKYDTNIILDYYKKKLDELNNENKALESTVNYTSELLIKLEEYDFDSYKNIVNDISYVSYCYNKFLLNSIELKDTEENSYMVENIGNNYKMLPYFLIENQNFLRNVIKDYISYNLLSNDKKDKAKSLVSNNIYSKNSNSLKLFNINTLIRNYLFQAFDVDKKEYSKVIESIKESKYYDLIVSVLYNDSMSLKCYDYLVSLEDKEQKIDYEEYEIIKDVYNIEEYKNTFLSCDESFYNEVNNSISFKYLLIKKSSATFYE